VQLPEKLLRSLEGIEGFDKEAFEQVHQGGERVTSIRINPFKLSEFTKVPSSGGDLGEVLHDSRFTIHERVPWSQYGYYLSERPSFTFDPLFHAGCYYVQEASSMFLEQALKQTIDITRSLKILDLAAAPGGKSTHIQSLISKNSLLVTNEVIRSRGNILKDNIIKWGCDNVVVTNNDPRDFARLENYFDVIVVDAPCSGSGLFRRDEEAIGEWSENNVQLCSQRQQRILADVWPALKKEGVLIYSTCSYSKEEDEEIVEWMNEELSIVNCQLSIDKNWKIVESTGGYRFWPDKVKGEGFFITCVKKWDGEDEEMK
jgi:16S rRNA C967 or C1407 C5-methylase (RsmB/RsmF family)